MSDAWDDKADAWTKVRENKARRAAERQGYALNRNRRRDPRALDYGTYSLSSAHAATTRTATPEGASLSEIEQFLGLKGSPDDQDAAD